MDVSEWLRKLGLEQYELAFRENKIGADVLPSLTAEDLKDLGVLSVGDRRRLLAAIAALKAAPTVGPAAQEAEPAAYAQAERRQVTVMFCDLVDSTALSSRLDPEDLREVIGRYHGCVAETVGRFDGFVAKYIGDGVLVYFGYPQAHEDDAEQSVRASLTLVEAIGKLSSQEPLKVRIGIASGLVVVGDLIGTGSSQEQAIVGDTPNLAARLQTLAEPNVVLIADATRRQVGGLFEVADLGLQSLKGFAEPQRVWRVLAEKHTLGRFEALRSRTAPLVGRDEELDLLLRRWEQAKVDGGRVVLISAEPGVGKSRLAEALLERISGNAHVRLRYFCSPHYQDSAFYPIVRQMERAAGFVPGEAPDAKLAKLQTVLAAATPSIEDVALVAELCSLPVAEIAPPLDLTPQRRKERTFEALLSQVERLSDEQPVVMIFEDVHWMDPSSRELLDLIIEKLAHWRVLLLATFRPEFQPVWAGQSHVTMLTLARLDRRNTEALVEKIAGDRALPIETVQEIAERTEGVPLFAEELTKAVLESGKEGIAAISAVPHSVLSVPATLHASLLARLDRLGFMAKEVAQIGAAIGREFTFELLCATATRSRTELQYAASKLVQAGLLLERGAPPQAKFLFKHALVQDTAYSTLLRGSRRLLHSRIADALLGNAVEAPAAAPEIVAHHLQNADRAVEAIKYWRQAGEQAVRRAANREGVEHLRRALSLLGTAPESAERWREELAILSQLSPALMNVHGWSAPVVGEAVERAAEVASKLESSAELTPAMVNRYLFNVSRGEFDRCEESATDLFRIGQELRDPEILLQAHHCAFPTRYFRGLFRDSMEHIDALLQLYDEERHAHHRYLYMGHDPGICGLGVGAVIQWVLGSREQAMHLEESAAALAMRLRHAPSFARALWHICDAQVAREDVATTSSTATELLKLSDENRLPQQRANALIFLGWALARSGTPAEGVSLLEQGLGALRQIGDRFYMTRSFCLMGESLLAAGRFNEGLEQVARGLDLATEIGEHWYVPRLHCAGADLLLHIRGPEDEAAESELRKALDIAKRQGAKGWELPAATKLARLWYERGRSGEARDLLAPIYGWFTKGFETFALKEAGTLLAELA